MQITTHDENGNPRRFRTRDGREVQIYAVHDSGTHPVHGAVKNGGRWVSRCWTANGLFWPLGESTEDLIEVKPPRYVWLNVYPDAVSRHYTCESADEAAVETRTHRIRVLIPDEPVWDE